MIRSNPNAKRSIRQQLDDLEYCLRTCLERIHEPKAFDDMCEALCSVALPTLNELLDNLEGYKVELPLSSEEHKDVQWMKEKDKFANLAEDFKNHSLCGENFPRIVKVLENLSRTLELVKRSFQAFTNSDLFADYCEREYAYFKMYGWNRRLDNIIDDMSEDFTSDDAMNYYEEQLNKYLTQLSEESTKLVDVKERVIYQEALGHKIWAKAHKTKDPTPVDELLFLAAAAEYFGDLAGKKVIFLPKKINPNQQNEAVDGMTIEQRRLEMKKQKLAKIRTTRFEHAVAWTCRTKAFYGAKLTDSFIRDLYTQMFDDERLIEPLCQKFQERNRQNSICRVVGEFWNAGLYTSGVKAQELADNLPLLNVESASVARYIRDAFSEDDPLGTWIRERLPKTS